jgi:hypothetical protein
MAAAERNPSHRTLLNSRALTQLLSLKGGHSNNTFSLAEMLKNKKTHKFFQFDNIFKLT